MQNNNTIFMKHRFIFLSNENQNQEKINKVKRLAGIAKNKLF